MQLVSQVLSFRLPCDLEMEMVLENLCFCLLAAVGRFDAIVSEVLLFLFAVGLLDVDCLLVCVSLFAVGVLDASGFRAFVCLLCCGRTCGSVGRKFQTCLSGFCGISGCRLFQLFLWFLFFVGFLAASGLKLKGVFGCTWI